MCCRERRSLMGVCSNYPGRMHGALNSSNLTNHRHGWYFQIQGPQEISLWLTFTMPDQSYKFNHKAYGSRRSRYKLTPEVQPQKHTLLPKHTQARYDFGHPEYKLRGPKYSTIDPWTANHELRQQKHSNERFG